MSCTMNDPNYHRRRRNHLYEELALYYATERCRWAPANPRRLFNLAFKRLYPAYRRWISSHQFLAVVYDTLGTRRGKPRGLFQTFDPARYTKSLPLEEHFINLFAQKLKGRAKNHLKREAAHGQVCDPTKLRAQPEMELVGTTQRSTRHGEWLASIPDALWQLDAEEHLVIRLKFWDDLSLREIGLALRQDHKTVGRRQEAALGKLRRYYGVEPGAAA